MTPLQPSTDQAVRHAVDAYIDGRLLPNFEGEASFETRNSTYRLLDGVLYSAPADGLIGAELVGWLIEFVNRAEISQTWRAGARAILVDTRNDGVKGPHIIVTSATRAFRKERVPSAPSLPSVGSQAAQDGSSANQRWGQRDPRQSPVLELRRSPPPRAPSPVGPRSDLPPLPPIPAPHAGASWGLHAEPPAPPPFVPRRPSTLPPPPLPPIPTPFADRHAAHAHHESPSQSRSRPMPIPPPPALPHLPATIPPPAMVPHLSQPIAHHGMPHVARSSTLPPPPPPRPLPRATAPQHRAPIAPPPPAPMSYDNDYIARRIAATVDAAVVAADDLEDGAPTARNTRGRSSSRLSHGGSVGGSSRYAAPPMPPASVPFLLSRSHQRGMPLR